MLTKIQLIQSATALVMVIGASVAPIVNVQAKPSIPTSNQRNFSDSPAAASNPAQPLRYGRNGIGIALGAKIETVSGAAEIALAEHLAASGVKFYGAYWCAHCQKQKSLFGDAAVAKLPYIECAANAQNSQRQLCKEKDIKMFPTWVINGKYITGTYDLKEIAALTGYQGSTDFKYHK